MTELGFGELLRRLRVSAGLTQEGLAERSGISAKAISDLERDPARSPRLDSVVALSEALEQDAEGKARLLAAARPGTAAAPAAPSVPATAASPLPATRARLPCPPTPLIGRDGVVRTLVDLIRERRYRLITVGGPGGVGKTRVAVEVARQLAADFPDGVVPVDLTPTREVTAAQSAIAAALGVTDEGPMSLWERVVSALSDRRLLLLLDNVEQVAQVRIPVFELVASCPGLTVLTTSRVVLGVRGERLYRIAPLELPPAGAAPQDSGGYAAVALFRERAEAAGAQLASDPGTDSAITAICNRLDGLPLAIELAAARAALLPPAALLARLQPRLSLLTDGPHDLPARQQTMRDAIAWSYELLDPAEQGLFRQLCVFSGGFDQADAETVAVRTGGGVFDLLTALARQNMLRQLAADGDAPRMTILETIREFGLEQLDAAGEADSTRARHARYFAGVVRGCCEAVPPEYGPVERDLDNVRAALSWAVEAEDTAIAFDIGGAMWRFWSRRGHLTEGRRWLDAILRLPDAGAGTRSVSAHRTQVLVGATTLAADQGAFDQAGVFCGLAVDAARQGADRPNLMLALTAHGFLARNRSRHAEAVDAYEEALALATELDDVPAAATISVGLGYVANISGDAERAAALAEQAGAAARELTDPRARADILLMLAWFAFHRRQPDRVDTYGREALELYRGLGETGEIAETLRVLGTSASNDGRFQEAESLLTDSRALHRERGDEYRAGVAAAVQAHAALNLGDLARAQALTDGALAAARRYDNPWALSMCLLVSGHLALAAKDFGRALDLLAEAARLMTVFNNPLYLSWCAEGLAGVAVGLGAWERAARLCRVRDAIMAKTGSHLPPIRPQSFTETTELIREHVAAADIPLPMDDPLHLLEQIIIELTQAGPEAAA